MALPTWKRACRWNRWVRGHRRMSGIQKKRKLHRNMTMLTTYSGRRRASMVRLYSLRDWPKATKQRMTKEALEGRASVGVCEEGVGGALSGSQSVISLRVLPMSSTLADLTPHPTPPTHTKKLKAIQCVARVMYTIVKHTLYRTRAGASHGWRGAASVSMTRKRIAVTQ